MEQSKIQRALELVASGVNPHAAAVQAGVASGSVYRRLKQIREKQAGRCPHCGGPVGPDGRHAG